MQCCEGSILTLNKGHFLVRLEAIISNMDEREKLEKI